MSSHCFHSESTSRDYLTGEIHPSEKKLPSSFNIVRSFLGIRSAREIKVSGCYTKKRKEKKGKKETRKTPPEESLFSEETRSAGSGGHRSVNRHFPPLESLFFSICPSTIPLNILAPPPEEAEYRIRSIRLGATMMHAFLSSRTFPSLPRTGIPERKISRSQHLHLFPRTFRRRSVRFPRTILTSSPRREPTRKCFEWGKRNVDGACQRVIGNCAGLLGPLALIASYFTESNGRPHSCLAALIYCPTKILARTIDNRRNTRCPGRPPGEGSSAAIFRRWPRFHELFTSDFTLGKSL